MGTIVIGYEGSDASERALARAAELAEALQAKLVVVSVERSSQPAAPVREPAPETAFVPGWTTGAPIPLGMSLPEPTTEQPSPEEPAQRPLVQARTRLAGRRLEVAYVAEAGPAAERLLEVADEHDADLLVVGSREHGLLERLLARPVEGSVARHAHRDVLLVY